MLSNRHVSSVHNGACSVISEKQLCNFVSKESFVIYEHRSQDNVKGYKLPD